LAAEKKARVDDVAVAGEEKERETKKRGEKGES